MTLKYEHFNGSIPQNVREKIGQVALLAQDEIVDSSCTGGEEYGSKHIDEIYGYDPGGFIPFQHGGFEVNELFRHDIDSSYHITAGQSEAAQRHEKYLYDCYASDRKEELKENGIDTEAEDFDSENYSIPEELQNDFSDYESEFWEPALLRFCIFVSKPKFQDVFDQNENGKRTVELSLSLNYSDAPYYRKKHDDDTLATLGYDLEEFMALDPEKIIAEFKTCIENFFEKEKNHDDQK